MKKLLVSLIAITSTVASVAYGCDSCGCKPANCKQKKIRVIHVTATNPQAMYDDTQYATTVLNSDGNVIEYPDYTEPTALTVAPTHRSAYTGDWYIGGRVALHLMSWENKYSGTPNNYKFDTSADHDKYSFEPVFGGNIFAGYRFAENWRGDLELGYMTQFSDSDNGFTFKMHTPYVTANAYYDFASGIYLGLGLGMAFPRATLDWEYFEPGSASETHLSFMGALMAGYSYYIGDSLALDFRYRLSGFTGPKWIRNVMPGVQDDNGVELSSLKTRIGFILDNSLSLGLRYEF